MHITTLKIENIRNLQTVEIAPKPGLNVLYGANGAGKTSVLEAIVVLSRGRSFRTKQAIELIGPARPFFRIFSESINSSNRVTRVGLERSAQHWRARINGRELSKLSKLLHELPIIVIEPNSHLLVSGSPEARRKYLDSGMFHVEHDYLDTWKRFTKILKQRNAALRRGQSNILDSVDEVFVISAIKLSKFRELHSKAVADKTVKLLEELSPELSSIQFKYSRGWNKEASLEEVLSVGRESDLARGSTGYGPHRADLTMTFRETVARNVLSRGEQKILASSLLLAQSEVLAELGEQPLLLLDDLASEFDREHHSRVLKKALRYGGQVWVTGTSEDSGSVNKTVFHVKHGVVEEVL